MRPTSRQTTGHREFTIALTVVWRLTGQRLEVLVTRRPLDAHLGGLWEFPGGKVEHDEGVVEAAARELAEETGLRVNPSQLTFFHEVTHRYPDRTVRLMGFLARVPEDATVRHLGIADHAWVGLDQLVTIPFPPANGPLTQAALTTLRTIQTTSDR